MKNNGQEQETRVIVVQQLPIPNQEETEKPEELLTVREVARRLRVDDTTVRRWIKSGALEAITLPHRGKRQAYRIKRSTLEALLNTTIDPSRR